MFSLIYKDEMLVTSNKTALAETLRVWSFVQKVAFIANLCLIDKQFCQCIVQCGA